VPVVHRVGLERPHDGGDGPDADADQQQATHRHYPCVAGRDHQPGCPQRQHRRAEQVGAEPAACRHERGHHQRRQEAHRVLRTDQRDRERGVAEHVAGVVDADREQPEVRGEERQRAQTQRSQRWVVGQRGQAGARQNQLGGPVNHLARAGETEQVQRQSEGGERCGGRQQRGLQVRRVLHLR
jgi:hypothetical protein